MPLRCRRFHDIFAYYASDYAITPPDATTFADYISLPFSMIIYAIFATPFSHFTPIAITLRRYFFAIIFAIISRFSPFSPPLISPMTPPLILRLADCRLPRFRYAPDAAASFRAMRCRAPFAAFRCRQRDADQADFAIDYQMPASAHDAATPFFADYAFAGLLR
jgi:hypothetical protein